jgi:hypothetical protein
MKYGKIIFGYKDTFSLDYTLSPIIAAGLIKFKEVITDAKNFDTVGVPTKVLVELFGDKQHEFTEEELSLGSKRWVEIIDKMIFAFSGEEPDIKDYAFSFGEWKTEPVEGGYRLLKSSLEPNNKEEYQRYKDDQLLYQNKKEEGLQLFAQYYENLWW